MVTRSLRPFLYCGALAFFGGAQISSQAWASTALVYESLQWDNQSFPDGCNQALQEVSRFVTFYDAALASLVARRGAKDKGVEDLYAVSELRTQYSELFPNTTEESPIDRLIITQLCQFQKIRAMELKPGETQKAAITSSDAELHTHLVKIAPKLFADAAGLIRRAVEKKHDEQRRAQFMMSKRDEIMKAKQAGREKAREVLR